MKWTMNFLWFSPKQLLVLCTFFIIFYIIRIVAWFVLFVATCMAGCVTMAVLNSHVRTTTTTVASQVTTSAALTNSTSTTIITQTTITTPTNSTSITSATMSTTIPTTTTFAMLLLNTFNIPCRLI